jgi:hypothetical protein
MTTTELLGFFWIALSTACFTAEVLIAAGVTIAIGSRMLLERYRRGAIEESLAIQEQTELRRMKATGR